MLRCEFDVDCDIFREMADHVFEPNHQELRTMLDKLQAAGTTDLFPFLSHFCMFDGRVVDEFLSRIPPQSVPSKDVARLLQITSGSANCSRAFQKIFTHFEKSLDLDEQKEKAIVRSMLHSGDMRNLQWCHDTRRIIVRETHISDPDLPETLRYLLQSGNTDVVFWLAKILAPNSKLLADPALNIFRLAR